MILGLLASFVRCCIIKLDMIMGATFGGDVPIPLVIICTEIATACVRDDVIIVNICVLISMWRPKRERCDDAVLMSSVTPVPYCRSFSLK